VTPHIEILPEKLCNQIAAGEVVERPASVVKELVENAIDAGANKIIIDIENGGKKKIMVSDNGHGMDRNDVFLCFERHATSKIRTEHDLFHLQYHGFRGEALPSIAAVSRLTVTSRAASDEVGTLLQVSGGKVNNSEHVGAPLGTCFVVKDLFFNLPARRKFLRRDETEFGHIAEVVTRLALAQPAIQFKLKHNGRLILDLYSQAHCLDRIAAVLGRTIITDMLEVDISSGALSLTGFMARPTVTRSTTNGMYCFVNGRFVKDRVLHHALMDGYRQLLMKGRYPVCILFLRLDPELVDVNVHPTKHEVRFHEQQRVHNFISQGIRAHLRQTDTEVAPSSSTVPQINVATVVTPTGGDDLGRNTTQLDFSAPHAGGSSMPDTVKVEPDLVVENVVSYAGRNCDSEPDAGAQFSVELSAAKVNGYYSSLTIIGQYHRSYIICEDQENLIIIDQHAAHERIGFERLKQQYSMGNIEQQELLFPVILELNVREDAELHEHAEQLTSLGFDLEPFGGTSWSLTAVPTYLDGNNAKTVVCDVLAEFSTMGSSGVSQEIFDAVLIKMACHGMIRANQKLNMLEMVALLQQLDEVDFNHNCPHGRPIVHNFSLRECEKRFRRVL